jgi:hypothetical protein
LKIQTVGFYQLTAKFIGLKYQGEFLLQRWNASMNYSKRPIIELKVVEAEFDLSSASGSLKVGIIHVQGLFPIH